MALAAKKLFLTIMNGDSLRNLKYFFNPKVHLQLRKDNIDFIATKNILS